MLCVQLFERDKKHVELTVAGSYLKAEVDFVINHLESTKNQLKLIDSGKVGELRIGFFWVRLRIAFYLTYLPS
ncbi:hypothetical protein [Algoriphagus boritolerans]|uniref:hypothetical protein n=1 Tax=Algoriphagus boritolerans TaxID=308111 RepID=UPI000AFE8B9F